MSIVSLPPVTGPSLREGLVHGSVQGYENGCRSRGGCAYGPDDGYLSCAEAAIARRSDWRLAGLPTNQPIPRRKPAPAPQRAAAPVRRSEPVRVAEPVIVEPKEVHGTTWGYRRGCTTDRGCPHWRLGRVTCRQARREYVREYKRRRIEGNGKPIEHGTNRGYLSGCQDESRCPNQRTGTTCAEARRAYKRERSYDAGARPRVLVEPDQGVREVLVSLQEAGWSLRRIASSAGVGLTTVCAIARSGGTDGADAVRRFTPATLEKLRGLAAAEQAEPGGLKAG
ncbi:MULTISPECIES: hypothetical protein [Bacteria]|uniref:hypothetical protein n=1 Tax=Bacteria TaxID=2 RepID=UPI003C7B28F8